MASSHGKIAWCVIKIVRIVVRLDGSHFWIPRSYRPTIHPSRNHLGSESSGGGEVRVNNSAETKILK